MTKIFSSTTCGANQNENEDAFDFRTHPRDSCVTIAALADGQGGRAGAAEAARLACRVCVDTAASRSVLELGSQDTWNDILQTADYEVAQDPHAGFTTIVGFCVTTEHVCGGSCGDSALVLGSGSGESSNLTAKQPKNPPMGSGKARFGYFQAALIRPWLLLAVSDGVWKYTGWEPLLEITHEQFGEQIVTDLLRIVTLATDRQLQDDFTLLMVAS